MPVLAFLCTYAAVFGVLLLAAVPAGPGQDLVVLTESRIIASGTLAWWPTFLVTVSAVVITDAMLFAFGVHAVRRLQARVAHRRFDRLLERLTPLGDLTIIAARFIPGSRILLMPAAATRGTTLLRFLLLDACAASVWVALMLAVGIWIFR